MPTSKQKRNNNLLLAARRSIQFICLGLIIGCTVQITSANITHSLDPFAAAKHDPLLTPSIKTILAEKSFLIDAAYAGERLVVVGERGHVMYSDNNGESWLQADVPVSVTLTAVTFEDDKFGWAVGHQGVILHSRDGGESWELQFNGLQAGKLWLEFAQEALQEAEASLVEGDDETKEAWMLADLAVGDAEVSLEFGPSQPLLDVFFLNKDEGIAIGSYGDIFRTVDGGKEWQVHRGAIKNPNNFHYYSIEQAPSGILYLVGERGGVYRSYDLGESWQKLDVPYDEGSFYRSLSFNYGAEEVLLIMGFGGHLYRSNDEGESWVKVHVPTNKSINDGVVLADGRVVLVGLNGTLLYSDTGGQTFSSRLNSQEMPYTSVLAMEEDSVLVTGGGGVRVLPVTIDEEKGQ